MRLRCVLRRLFSPQPLGNCLWWAAIAGNEPDHSGMPGTHRIITFSSYLLPWNSLSSFTSPEIVQLAFSMRVCVCVFVCVCVWVCLFFCLYMCMWYVSMCVWVCFLCVSLSMSFCVCVCVWVVCVRVGVNSVGSSYHNRPLLIGLFPRSGLITLVPWADTDTAGCTPQKEEETIATPTSFMIWCLS